MKHLILTLSLILGLATSGFSASLKGWEVFGLSQETRLTDVEVIKGLDDHSELGKRYEINPPKPPKFLKDFTISYSDKFGICSIEATGRAIDHEREGIAAVIEHNLIEKYGEPYLREKKEDIVEKSTTTWLVSEPSTDPNFTIKFETDNSTYCCIFPNLTLTYNFFSYNDECVKASIEEINSETAPIDAKSLSKSYGVSPSDF